MAHDKATRDALRRAYVFDRLSLDKAASVTGVSYPTARNWKNKAKANGDDWDKIRTAHTMAGGEIEDIARQLLTDLIVQYQTTIDLIKGDSDINAIQRVELLTSLSDSYNKALSASKKLVPETSKLATALEVLDKLSDYIKANNPQQLIVFVEILQGFAEKLEKELK